jgi:hypothetical protein
MRVPLVGLVVALSSVVSCSSAKNESGFTTPQTGNGNGNGATTVPSGDAGNGLTNDGPPPSLGGSGIDAGTQDGGTTTLDGGFTCVKNPSQYDIPNNNCDDDDDGKIDNVLVCDGSLTAAGVAGDFLSAMGVCRVSADANHWGVVSASYTNGHSQTTAGPDNFAEQHGILSTFGTVIVPREGYMFGVLSSGSASATDSDNGPLFKGGKNGMQSTSGDVPTGFPKSSATCPVASDVNDVIDLKVQVRVPTNAKGLSFDFDFWSGEWPDYVCSTFNDSFIAYLTSAAFNGGAPDNISFDTNGNTISVNNDFFGACTPGVETGCMSGGATSTSVCSDGPSQLAGTGFAAATTPKAYCGSVKSTSGGATSWLTSQAPVKPGEVISLEFLIWDTGDNSYDSSVILDNFTWVPDPLPPVPITVPSPPPPPPPPPK